MALPAAEEIVRLLHVVLIKGDGVKSSVHRNFPGWCNRPDAGVAGNYAKTSVSTGRFFNSFRSFDDK